MSPSVNYHCPCQASVSSPPQPHLPSSSHSFHPLHELYFCEECDAVRCNRCVSIEVSGYYCPNCLFEVPSASVRAEKNRCARNCFLCPHCRNTLSVVSSDPPEYGDTLSTPAQVGVVGEPPFFLYCNNCRWDSAEIGITFEKPTGLAVQLQKTEDSAPELQEFDRLKEHFEPFLRASSLSSHLPSTTPHSVHINPITAAASSALARDIPGVSKYNPLARSRTGKDKNINKDELPEYRSRIAIGSANSMQPGGVEDVEWMKHLDSPTQISSFQQRSVGSWSTPLFSRDLKPLRIPLHSKLTKRCAVCRHILIKPEQKAQSVRYKIKLVAANYLPAVTVNMPHLHVLPKRTQALKSSLTKSTWQQENDLAREYAVDRLIAGKTYAFHLALTNPLYDQIQVRLVVQRPSDKEVSRGSGGAITESEIQNEKKPPFTINLPTGSFSISPFAEDWEYDDDEEMFDENEDGATSETQVFNSKLRSSKKVSANTKTVGVLERKANTTVVGGEVVIEKDGIGQVKFNMFVSYTYRSDDPSPQEEDDPGSRGSAALTKVAQETKTFSFYTVVDLGVISAKDEVKVDN